SAFFGRLQYRRITSSPFTMRTSHLALPASQETSTRSARIPASYCASEPASRCAAIFRVPDSSCVHSELPASFAHPSYTTRPALSSTATLPLGCPVPLVCNFEQTDA